jgi:hypothetical protein
MAGWHVDNQAFTFAIHHPLEGSGHNFVVSTRNELWPHLIYEPHEGIAGLFLLEHVLTAGQVLQNLGFLVIR